MRCLLSAAPTTITLAASAATLATGQLVNITATVSSTSIPSGGQVTFTDGSNSLGSATVVGGTAVLNNVALPLGANVISASYSGSAPNFAASSTGTGSGISSTSLITTVAGNGSPGAAGNGGAATAADVQDPLDVAVDSAGDLFITADYQIREVNHATGVITAIAGQAGIGGLTTSGIQATAAELANPLGLAVDSSGDVFIADESDRIQEIVHSTGIIKTVAGNGFAGFSGDGGQATAAALGDPTQIAVDSSGDLFIADAQNSRIREVTPGGIITTVAGGGTGSEGDNGPATAATLLGAGGVAVDSAGDIFISEIGEGRIREVNASTRIITTVAGNGTEGDTHDGSKATAAEIYDPTSVAVDAAGNIYISDYQDERVREVNASTGIITTAAGDGFSGYGGDGGPATAAGLNSPGDAVADAFGDLIIADPGNNRVREVAAGGAVTVIVNAPVLAATTTTLSASATSVSLGQAITLTATVASTSVPGDGTVTFSAGSNTLGTATVSAGRATLSNVVLPLGSSVISASYGGDGTNFAASSTGTTTGILPSSILTTIAGNGLTGAAGSGSQATATAVQNPIGVAEDSAGDLFIAGYSQILEVNHATGVIKTIAGQAGELGFSGDGGPATAAVLANPSGIAIDTAGDVFIADQLNNRVREINHATGIITTVAGNGNAGYSGDGIQATAAELNDPTHVAVDSSGDLFISDLDNDRIREVTPGGVISTVAGGGSNPVVDGDNGPATAATLEGAASIVLDSAGDLFIAEIGAGRVREVNATTHVITTVAGNGTEGYAGDNGPATAAELNDPTSLAVDAAGNIFIADSNDNRVREVNHATGIISTVAGIGAPVYGGDGGPATAAGIDNPYDVTLDAAGDLIIADPGDNRVREIAGGAAVTVTVTPAAAVTTTTLSATSTSFTYGQTVKLTATVASTTTPSEGSVSFVHAPATLGSQSVSAGSAALSGVLLPAGTDVVTATYTDALNNYASSAGSTTFTVSRAAPTLSLSDASGIFNSAAFAAADSVAGVVSGVDSAPAASLEGVVPSLTYYSGTSATGTALSGAPTPVGTYTVLASFAGSTDYVSGAASVTFTINKAAPTVAVTDAGGPFTGAAFTATTASVEGVAPSLTYYSGASATGTPLTGAPTAIGTYAVLASFAGSTDYTSGTASTTFIIAAATLPTTIAVTASAGSITYGQTVNLTATVSSTATPPEGTVTFMDGATTLGSRPVSGGTATLSNVSLPAGAALITVSYTDPSAAFGPSSTSIGPNSIITTVAGNGSTSFTGDGGQATAAALNGPVDVAVDSSGNLFIADETNGRVREVNHATGVITTVAGNGTQGYSGDGGPATAAELYDLAGIAVDQAGDLFLVDQGNERIREVNHATGIITTIAGDGGEGFSGDNGPATAAQLTDPYAVTVDSAGDVFVADSGVGRIREINTAGVITTVAAGYSLLGGQLASDTSGDVVFVAEGNNRVYQWNHATGIITTIAGNGAQGFAGDGGPAATAELNGPEGVAVDGAGDVFITDSANQRLREVNAVTGTISTIAGNGTFAYAGDNGPASAAKLWYPEGLALDASGDLFIADQGNSRIREIAAAPITVAVSQAAPTVAVTDAGGTYKAAAFPATATVNGLASLESVAPSLTYYAGASATGTALSGAPSTAGTYTVLASFAGSADYLSGAASTTFSISKAAPALSVTDNGGPYTGAAFTATALSLEGVSPSLTYYSGASATGTPLSGAPTPVGTYTVLASFAGSADYTSGTASSTFTIVPGLPPTTITVAASATTLLLGQSVNLTATVASTSVPNDGTVTFLDGAVTLGTSPVSAGTAALSNVVLTSGTHQISADYVGDGVNFGNSVTVGTIGSASLITTIAGNGTSGYAGDNGPATAAEFKSPVGIAVDSAGDVFIADAGADVIREVKPNGVITTVAGSGTGGYSGDGGPATAAELSLNGLFDGLAVDAAGDLFIADAGNDRVREVNHATGLITTVAGNGSLTFSGMNGPATAAGVNPSGIALDAAGDLFISDNYFNRILEVNHASGVITSIAGNGTIGYTGNNGPATAAEMFEPEGLTVDSAGDVFFVDNGNRVVREINAATQIITTVVGGGSFSVNSGDGGQATAATLLNPSDVKLDAAGDLIISDFEDWRVREVNAATGIIRTIAGDGNVTYLGNNIPATSTGLTPDDVALDAAGDLFISDWSNYGVREIAATPALSLTVTTATLNAPTVTAAATLENTQSASGLVIAPNAADAGIAADFQITGISGGALFLADGLTPVTNGQFITVAQGAAGLRFTPTANSFAPGSFSVQSATGPDAAGLGGSIVKGAITVTPVAHAPTVTNATSLENGQTTAGLVITPNALDIGAVTNFQITAISGGSLFLGDGVTPLASGQFITLAQGGAGLKFTPTVNSTAPGSFNVQASISATAGGLGGSTVTATISVTPIVLAPTVTNVTTRENTQSTSGLVIAPSPLSGATVSDFQITAITGGALFLSDGVTPVTSGQFITVAQGAAGLTFTPSANSIAPGSFVVQASTSAAAAGLGGPTVTATINVLPVPHTPTVTNATALQNAQSTTGLVITPSVLDAGTVTNFQITGITGGSLFLNDGVTPVSNGQFITAVQGAAGLTFTPTANSTAPGSFVVQASTSATALGLGGAAVTATITIAVNPPTSSVLALPPRASVISFPVGWFGAEGSGGPVASYDISVSVDGGPFQPWLTGTTLTTSTYTATMGHTYRFISRAYDSAGNAEPLHAAADATITITATPWQNPANPLDVLGTGGLITPNDALAVINYLNTHVAGITLPPTYTTGANYLDVLGTGTVIPNDALQIINYLNTHSTAAPAVSSAAPAAVPAAIVVAQSTVRTDVSPASDGDAAVLSGGVSQISPSAAAAVSPAVVAAASLVGLPSGSASSPASAAAATSSSGPAPPGVNSAPATTAAPVTAGRWTNQRSSPGAIDAVLAKPRLDWLD